MFNTASIILRIFSVSFSKNYPITIDVVTENKELNWTVQVPKDSIFYFFNSKFYDGSLKNVIREINDFLEVVTLFKYLGKENYSSTKESLKKLLLLCPASWLAMLANKNLLTTEDYNNLKVRREEIFNAISQLENNEVLLQQIANKQEPCGQFFSDASCGSCLSFLPFTSSALSYAERAKALLAQSTIKEEEVSDDPNAPLLRLDH